jgi:hypothetical protein
MSRSMIKTAAVLALPALGVLGLARQSDAAVIYGLTENNNVFRFDTTNTVDIGGADALPIESGVFVQGLGGAELLNIDFRPSTGQLYGLTTDNRVVTINPDTGAITGSQNLSTPLNGTSFGFDFNPQVDRIRIVSDTGQNLRFNPADGSLIVDTPISGGQSIVGAAYNNILGGTTTLYTIDSLNDVLNRQDPANSGTQVEVGPLMAGDVQIDTTNRVGFDIGPDNVAYAAFNEIGFSLSDLYTINLQTGDIEFVGQIGGGLFVRDIAVVVPEPATAGLLAVGALLAVRRRRRA